MVFSAWLISYDGITLMIIRDSSAENHSFNTISLRHWFLLIQIII